MTKALKSSSSGRRKVAPRSIWVGILVTGIVFSLILAAGNLPTARGETGWNKTYGGTGDDVGYSVIQTNDGGFVITGSTYVPSASNDYVYLVKTDSAGIMQWNKTYQGAGEGVGYSVVQTNDGGYAITGETFSPGANGGDVYLVKTDSAGIMQWNKTYGGVGDDAGIFVVQTNDRGFAMAGYTGSFGGGGYDVYLIKTDSAGTMQWNKTYGGTGTDVGSSVVQTSDGGYAIGAQTTSFGAGNDDFYLIKTNSAGTMQWNKTYGGTGDDAGSFLVQTNDGGYALAGITDSFGAGGNDVYLVRTDAVGTMQWNKTYGGTGVDGGESLVQTNDGGFGIAGWTTSLGAGNDDVYLVKTDSAGIMQWNKTYGGPNDDVGYSVVQTNDGGYAIAGYTGSFGAGGYDVYLVKTDSILNPMPSPSSTSAPIAGPSPTPASTASSSPNIMSTPKPATTAPAIPEFPSAIMGILVLMALTIVTLFCSKKQKKQSKGNATQKGMHMFNL